MFVEQVIQERLRYTPLGWTKKYEFSETDASFALDVIDQWVDETAGPRAHVDPVALPWDAIRTLLSQSIYGGRIDNSFDQIALDSFISSLFHPSKYSSGAALVSDSSGAPLLSLPDSLNRQVCQFVALHERGRFVCPSCPTLGETQWINSKY